MTHETSRRSFIKTVGAGVAAGLFLGHNAQAAPQRSYKISLAAWSLHRSIGKGEGKIPMLDMPKIARQEFDIEAIELVSTMLASTDAAYFDNLGKNAADNNVKLLLIMIDGQGEIAAEQEDARRKAVENHKKWIDIAGGFGCHSIRMNWAGAPENVLKDPVQTKAVIDRSVPGFQALSEYGDSKGLYVIIENHGGASSHPEAVVQLMEAVNHPRFGTLPDFGNFPDDVDPYVATDILMSYAHKGVSAKCYDFDETTGLETKLDFPRLIAIVADKHGYDGYIGIEYEGDRMSEFDGVRACKKLLDRLREGQA